MASRASLSDCSMPLKSGAAGAGVDGLGGADGEALGAVLVGAAPSEMFSVMVEPRASAGSAGLTDTTWPAGVPPPGTVFRTTL